MSEHNFWTRIRTGIKAIDHLAEMSRVENIVEPGMPDVNFCFGKGTEGWMELKWCEAMPSRPDTPVFRNGGLRDAQIIWIHKRVKAGGRVFIVCQIETMVFIVHGCHATVFNTWNLETLYKNARFKFIGKGLPWLEFVRCLSTESTYG